MSKFLTDLIVKKLTDSDDSWEVVQDFSYQSDKLGATVTVLAGFVTDFASTPRPVWILFPKDGRWDGAAVIHDFLYHTHSFKRSVCDGVFLEALAVLGVPFAQRWTMYLAVRSFGWMFYGK